MRKLTSGLLLWLFFQGIEFPSITGSGPIFYVGSHTHGEPLIMENGVSVPSDFPHIEVFINNQPDSGKIFINNWGGTPYMIIFENSGAHYFYRRTSDRQRDFKVQPNGLLTFRYPPRINNIPGGAFLAMDSSYCVVDTFLAAPGYAVDEYKILFKNFLLEGYTESGLMERDSAPGSILSGFLSSRKQEAG